MEAEVIKQLVPFGIVGLAIVAILVLALRPINKNAAANMWLAIGAMIVIAALAIFDKFMPIFAKPPPAPNPPVPGQVRELLWIDTGIAADWGGNDIASTAGSTPRYKVQQTELCDREGEIATCWQNRPNGFPANVPTDIVGAPPQWCTYKNVDSIKLSTRPNGFAPPGHVFLCSHTIPR